LIPYVLFGTLVLGIGLSVVRATPALAQPKGSSNKAISDHLELRATHVVAGQSIKGTLVVENRGNAINLTKVATVTIRRRDRKTSTQLAGCRPDVGLGLSNSHYRQEISFLVQCSPKPFIIRHGATRIPVTIYTTYTGCAQPGGTVTPTNPACLANGPPPMPVGRYKTQVVWSETVPLPTPKAVTVTVVAAK
jgi:hypothetical protein